MIPKRQTVLFCLILITINDIEGKSESILHKIEEHPPHPYFLITFEKVLSKNGDVTYKEVSKKQVISPQTAFSNKHENIRQNKLTNPQQENLFLKDTTKKYKEKNYTDAANEGADSLIGSTIEKFSPDELFNNFVDKLVGYLKPLEERSEQVTEVASDITSWTWSSTIVTAISFLAFILYL